MTKRSGMDLTDERIASWASGRPNNPCTADGVYMALEIQRHRAVDLSALDGIDVAPDLIEDLVEEAIAPDAAQESSPPQAENQIAHEDNKKRTIEVDVVDNLLRAIAIVHGDQAAIRWRRIVARITAARARIQP